MKIKIKKNGMANIIKKFENKLKLFEFVQNNIESIIFSNDEKENKKCQILRTTNINKFTINELIEMIDYVKI